MKSRNRLTLHPIQTVGLAAILAACAQTPIEHPGPPSDLVGEVFLDRAIQIPPEDSLLEVGLLIFTANSNEQEDYKIGDWVFDEIIQKETQFLPSLLKDTLVASNQWGAVRIIPEHDPSLDLFLSGEILRSNGQTLELRVQVIDSSGREWLNKIYADQSDFEDYPKSTRFTLDNTFDATNFIDPFQDIYNRIANDLVEVRSRLSDEALDELNLVTDMLYARDLSPNTFAHTLVVGEDGLLRVNGLPALDDPMLIRVADMKYRHHLFIDTVDEYYQTLYNDIQPAYVLWRRYSIDQLSELDAARQQASRNDYGRSSGFLSLSQRYDRYKWSKIFEREFNDLAVGFNNELAPAILELNSRVHGLSGTMEQQYREWRGILRGLFELEIAESATE